MVQNALKRAGLSRSVDWGVWQLTDEGLEESSEVVDQEMTPDERIDAAIEELHESVSSELLFVLHDHSPQFFDRLVLDVLQAMGYGTGEQSIDHRGASGDDGTSPEFECPWRRDAERLRTP